MTPFFSIIIPTYNASAFIKDCIDSLLEQNYNNYEIIIMDGVSTDGTLSFLKSISDKRIKIYSKKDNGIYDAMNKAIQRASGDWLYFLGSDDRLYSKDTLGTISKSCVRGADVVYGNVVSEKFTGVYAGEFDRDKILYKNICHQAIFYHKRVFEKLGDFDLGFKVYADWDFNLRWFLSPRIARKYVDVVVARYGAGGFSEIGDAKFYEMRWLRYLCYSKNQMPVVLKVILVKQELIRGYRKRDFKYIFQVLMTLPTIFLAIPIPQKS